MPRFDEQQAEEHLRAVRLQEEEQLAEILSKKYNLPYLNLDTITIDASAVSLVPETQAVEGELAVIQVVGKKIKVAVRNPNSERAQEVIENLKQKRYRPQIFMVSRRSLEKAWEKYKEAKRARPVLKGMVIVDNEIMPAEMQNLRTIQHLRAILEPLTASEEDRRLSLTLEVLLRGALILEVSDIHIKPEQDKTRLRIRIDGVLHDVMFFSKRVYNLLLSRIKLTGGIKLNIRERAQDGRFTIRGAEDEDIEVRISMLPGSYGESIVLRILSPKLIVLSLHDLGMQKPVLDLMMEELEKPNGMILTTGPTGSGKTTTLYAFVRHINTPGIHIVTIEDPIEYHLQGINQTQIDESKGYTFANGLRSIVRQDPDVILVGEIRDLETAEIAMHAALTGHLVFSTLHTNNAPGTIPRLIDLKVQPNIIAPAINVTMAQRLVRRLCTTCRKPSAPTGEELQYMEEALNELPPPFTKPEDMGTARVWHAPGCDDCGGIGYKGRISIFEVFVIDDNIERLILQTPSEAQIREAAKQQGMLTMQQDGILKALEGITAVEEVQRVTGEAVEN